MLHRTTLMIPGELVKEAQDAGLNISKICRVALAEKVEILKKAGFIKEKETCQKQ